MAASEIVVANMALSNLGSGKTIASLTEKSDEARVLSLFFTDARDATLRDVDWRFATQYSTLGLVTTSDDDTHINDEWGYAYRYPTTCVHLRRILSGTRNDQRGTRVPYILSRDSGGLLILTDMEDAKMEYTHKVTAPASWPSDFTLAFSYRLSALAAPRLTNGDPWKVGAKCLESYRMEIERAKANTYNEEQREDAPDSEFITVRN